MRVWPLTLFVTTCFVAPRISQGQLVGTFDLEHGKDGFGVRSHGIVEAIAPHRKKFYPLPQSTPQEYMRLRPADFRLNPFEPIEYDREEVIGPYQVEDEKIWFGKAFYDAESLRGVGAFGYFDTSDRKYVLYSPREVAQYEVSAILVQPDFVWVALDHFGEDISTFPGGIIRWNRSTHELHRFPIEFVVTRLKLQSDGTLRLTTRGGYALLHADEIQRFLNNGTRIKKFPPPPSHY